MKIPLPAQIQYAEYHRNSLLRLREEGTVMTEGPDLQTRLDIQEGICLTLEWLAVYRDDFLEYVKHRKEQAE